ncbi:restriction endonuclease [Cytophagales bacterium WSM2-2]|nr:restriction endonuclease [Cytophagales bacterium WSM2-2]
METLLNPPRTIKEVYEMLPEGTLAELINNNLYISPAPLYDHQKIVKGISKELDKLVEDTGIGIVVNSPFDIKLDKANVVQPDIAVILKSNPHQIIEGRYSGVPDLVIEVLSAGNRNHDLVIKKELYERFGVKEYWIVDPETNLALVFSLHENQYVKFWEGTRRVHSALLQANLEF